MTQSTYEVRVNECSQPWLSSSRWDCAFIIAPAVVTALVVICFRGWFESFSEVPLWGWVVLVLVVDVAHVYATLFRTYMDKEAFARNHTLLTVLPIACWVVGAMLYSMDAILFWRALAYLAVFHFIRQQYGFVALYSRREPEPFAKLRWLDQLVLYLATLYPILYWHTHLPREFHWFIDGDFVGNIPGIVADAAFVVYMLAGILYLAKEGLLYKTTGFFNVPRNLLIGGTALSWWVGIVSLNSDMAFTMTNVIAHGVPYMALIWLHHHLKKDAPSSVPETKGNFELIRKVALTYLPAFLLFLIVLAYLEEGLWAGFVWREHLGFFPQFAALPHLEDPLVLALLVPLLSLPQSTHYVLDGFIWRVKDKDSIWSASQ